MSDVSPVHGGPAVLSSDGHWWWDGQSWRPRTRRGPVQILLAVGSSICIFNALALVFLALPLVRSGNELAVILVGEVIYVVAAVNLIRTRGFRRDKYDQLSPLGKVVCWLCAGPGIVNAICLLGALALAFLIWSGNGGANVEWDSVRDVWVPVAPIPDA